MRRSSIYNQLLVFQTIVQENSIRGAARKLEMAAPSVSATLKSLEQTIGLPLIMRTTRQMDLTEAGRRLLQETLQPMQKIDRALEQTQDLVEVPSGTVKITLPRFVYELFLKKIFANFCEEYPEILLEISVFDGTVDIVEKGFDIGIRFGYKVQESMVTKPISPKMRDAVFAAPVYAEQFGIPRNIKELINHKLIHYRFISSNQLATLHLMHNGAEVPIQMPNALVVNDTGVMIDSALAGIGIGRLVEPCVSSYLDEGQLLPVLERNWIEVSPLHIYFAQYSQKAKRVRVLIDYLLDSKINSWSK